MSDLISRQIAIEHIKKRLYETALNNIEVSAYEDMAANRIDVWMNEVPSAEPKIIRCKDCKHRYIEDMIWNCPFGLMGGENFFCGYGSLGTVEKRMIDYDPCEDCRLYGDDYSYDEDGNLMSNCYDCPLRGGEYDNIH